MNCKTIKFLVIAIGIFSSFSILSCKKSDTTPSYFLNATVNGIPFKSTVVNGQLKNGIIAVTGGSSLKTDTTAISFGFNQNVTINTQHNFNDPNQSGLAYADSKTQTLYITDSTKKASGLYTVTSFNTKDSTVAGTFSGTVVDINGTSTITITNGSFYSKVSTKSSNSLGLAKPNAILGLNKILFPKL